MDNQSAENNPKPINKTVKDQNPNVSVPGDDLASPDSDISIPEDDPTSPAEKINQEIIEILDVHKVDVPDSAKGEIRLAVMRSYYSEWSGPLPNPQAFGAYGDFLPSAPERILVMAEKEQTNRHENERISLKAGVDCRNREIDIDEQNAKSDNKLQAIGLYLAFVLAIVFTGFAIYSLNRGNSFSGLASLFTGIALIIGPFIYWRTKGGQSIKK